MFLSDICVRRPVLATVINLLLVVFGLVAFNQLSLREYPDVDPPVVSVETTYPGAAASVVETRITQLIEDRIAGIEGIEYISSKSQDGRSDITIEFSIDRDIDAAANDVRDRVGGILDDIPEEADPPEIQKVDSNADVIMWLNLVSERMTVMELTDYARRNLQDRFSALEGVARVRIGGGLEKSMRIWLDKNKMAARGLTVLDVETALRQENIELPAGSVESDMRQFSVRIIRNYANPEDFEKLVIHRGEDGYLVRLGDIAQVEIGAVEARNMFRGNGVPMVGIGIIKQSTANTLDVSQKAQEEADRVNQTLPDGMQLMQSYDTSVFIRGAISEVYKTLFIAIGLVILVILLFLRNVRAMLVPAVTVPVSIIAAFSVLLMLGYSINLLTLLALVLAIGLVVDDAVVVLENIHRRMELGEPAKVAAYRGTRQVGFAVIATTLVLIAVFIPITFLQGNTGRLFAEFAVTMAAAVSFSSIVALSLSPVIASKFLKNHVTSPRFAGEDAPRNNLGGMERRYQALLKIALAKPLAFIIIFVVFLFGIYGLFKIIPSEFVPKEDRGAFFIIVNGPEGASFNYISDYMDNVETRLMPLVEGGEVTRLLVRAPRAFGNTETFSNGIGILVLSDWAGRRSANEIMADVRNKTSDLPGIQIFPIMRQGLGGRVSKPLQFVIGGPNYQALAQWRDIMLEKAAENPNLLGLDHDLKETKPQFQIEINRDRAADLGISIETIGRTLETMLGSRRVTTFIDAGEEYDVIVKGEENLQRSAFDIGNIYVESKHSGKLIPISNLVSISEFAAATELNRYNKIRSVTLEANLADGYSLGQALDYMEGLVREHLPPEATIAYRGQSLEHVKASGDTMFVFMLALLIVFLVLAAQFESFVHPFIIMLSVPLAIVGGLLGLYLTGQTLNIYSQIGLIMLIGLAAKNSILIVEFINQLRLEGMDFDEAILQASCIRLRPILMTAITTLAGAMPLIISSGAGAETRYVIGVVVFSGVISAILFTLFMIPIAYRIFAKRAGLPGAWEKQLDEAIKEHGSL